MYCNDHFEIQKRYPAPKVVHLRVKGELDLCTSLPLRESLAAAFGERPDVVAVDLSDVRFMDAAGLGVLADGARRGADARARFAVICPPRHRVERLLQLAGLHRVLNIHESADDALGPWLGSEEEAVSAGEAVLS